MTRPPVGSTGTLAELQVEPGDVVQCITNNKRFRGVGDVFTIDARGYAVSAKIDAFTPKRDHDYGRTYRLISRANPGQPALQIKAGKYYRTRDGRKVGPMERDEVDGKDWRKKDDSAHLWHDDGSRWLDDFDSDLIAEWQDDQPAHIITHEGREYDLTALETPFGLLPEPVREALRAWPHGFEIYNSDETGSRGAWANAPCTIWDWHTVRAKPAPTETRIVCYRGGRGVNYEYGKAKEHGTCIKRPDGSLDWASWEDAE